MVKLLLKKGANPDIISNRHEAALHFSIFEGSLDITNLLLQKSRKHINLQGYKGRTPLHYAAGSKNASVDLIKALIEAGGDFS